MASLQDAPGGSNFVGTLLGLPQVHFDGGEIRISSELTFQMVRYLSMLRHQPAWDTRYTAREVWGWLGQSEEVGGVIAPPLTGHALDLDRVVAQRVVDEVLETGRVQEREWRSTVYQTQRKAA